MDPQDLLYTNKFVSKDVITNSDLKMGTKYYKNFQDNIDKRSSLTNKYLNTNLKDGDPININKTESKPWPPSNNRNFKPIFSNAVSDVVENKYIKAIRTILSIYSKDRNKKKSIMPNNYRMSMGKEFINIYKIKLIDLNIPNTIPPVNLSNNIIRWIYPTLDIINYTNTGDSLYPFFETMSNLPPYFWYYSNADTIPYNDFNEQDSTIEDPQDVYTAFIDSGFYSTKTLKKKLEEKMNNVLHNIKEGIVSIYNKNYNQRLLNNTNHSFNVDINPYTSVCTIINRAEEIQVLSIQTLPTSIMRSPSYNNNLPDQDTINYNFNSDIFWNFFYYEINKYMDEIVNPPEQHTYKHYDIMNGKYIFDYNKIAGTNDTGLFKSNTSDKDISGAEINGYAPSFIITVKNIGDIYGGINNSNNYTNFATWTQEARISYRPNCYPIIFTNMPSVGGIPSNLINYVEFYDLFFLNNNNKYSNNKSDYLKLKGIYSFYYHFDNIRIGNEIFKRYAFYIHTNSFLKRPGYLFSHAGFIRCKTQETIIISESLYNVMGNNQKCVKSTTLNDNDNIDVNYQDCFCTTKGSTKGDSLVKNYVTNNTMNICYYGEWMNTNNMKNKDTLPMCGRGLPFSFKNSLSLNNDDRNTCDGIRESILILLGWNKLSGQNNNYGEYSPFKFIHRNIDTIESNIEEYSKIVSNEDYTSINNNDENSKDLLSNKKKCEIVYNFNTIPQNLLDIELISGGEYVFSSLPFIFLRLTFPSLPDDTISNQLYRAESDKILTNSVYNYYYNNPLTNLDDLGNSYQSNPQLYPFETNSRINNEILEREEEVFQNCSLKTSNYLLKKNTGVIFAKINMNSIPQNSYNKRNYDYEFTFYDKPLESVNEINIEFVSPDGNLINLRQDHNITLEIMEFRDVLKETLFDTKHGEVVTTGIKKV